VDDANADYDSDNEEEPEPDEYLGIFLEIVDGHALAKCRFSLGNVDEKFVKSAGMFSVFRSKLPSCK
jgi:hypothetical protein